MSAYPQLRPGVMALTLPLPWYHQWNNLHWQTVEVLDHPLEQTINGESYWVCEVKFPSGCLPPQNESRFGWLCDFLLVPDDDQRRQFARESDRPVVA